mmetsp:Transcript_26731/g.37905  ORF Transcript_26731/g.37905 Transcript_26731/m.37905 type:complete len:93 (-) Transcript_26731:474-752(-)
METTKKTSKRSVLINPSKHIALSVAHQEYGKLFSFQLAQMISAVINRGQNLHDVLRTDLGNMTIIIRQVENIQLPTYVFFAFLNFDPITSSN